MSSTIEEFKRLKQELEESGVSFRVRAAQYGLPEKYRDAQFVFYDMERVRGLPQCLLISYSGSSGSINPEEVLSLDLEYVHMTIEGFRGHEAPWNDLWADFRTKEMRLDTSEDDPQRPALDEVLWQVAQNLAYNYRFEPISKRVAT